MSASVLVVLAALLAACGSGAGSGAGTDAPDATPVAGDGPVTLRFWYMPNGSEPGAAMQAELDAFTEAHPGIEVEGTIVTWEKALTSLATATQSGAGPDVTQLGSTWVSGLAETGPFRAWDEPAIDELGGRGAFVPESWASTMDASGATVAIPWVVDTRVLFYRTDIFDELGLDPEVALADWESLEATLAHIEAETDIVPWGVPGRNDWNVVHNAVPWLWSAGGNVVSDDGSQVLLDSEESLTGLMTFQRLVSRYGHEGALASSDADSQQLFADGEYAITMSGPWFVSFLSNAPDNPTHENWAVAPTPAGPGGRSSFLGGSHLAVFDETEHPEEAAALIAFLTSKESQDRYADTIGMIPARSDADKPDGFAEALASGRQYTHFPGWLEVETTLQRYLSRMWERVETTGEPLDESEMRALLAEAHAGLAAALERREH